RHFVRQGVGIYDRAVIAPSRVAVDEKITTAVAADLTESDRRKSNSFLGSLRCRRPAVSVRKYKQFAYIVDITKISLFGPGPDFKLSNIFCFTDSGRDWPDCRSIIN